MNIKRNTLVVDGNWMLLSRLWIISDRFKMDGKEEEKERGGEELKDMLARSLILTLNRYPMIEDIIIVSDGGSWRRKVKCPIKREEGGGYKATRDYEKVDFNKVWEVWDEFLKGCERRGIKTCKGVNIEGDDWVWWWTRVLSDKGGNVLIWSVDADLKQLIEGGKEGKGAVVWIGDRENICMDERLREEDWEGREADFFLTPIRMTNPLIESLQRNPYLSHITYIDPQKVIMEKVICGDVSDNMRSVCEVRGEGRRRGVGKKEWEKIREKLNIETVEELKDRKGEVEEELLKKRMREGVKKGDVEKMIDYNYKMMRLKEEVYPEEILGRLKEEEKAECADMDMIRSNYKTLLINKEEKGMEDLFNSIEDDIPF